MFIYLFIYFLTFRNPLLSSAEGDVAVSMLLLLKNNALTFHLG